MRFHPSFTVSSSIQILELIAWTLRRWGGKEGLLAAMEKMKSELMLLGVASLILIAFQNDITSYCSKYLPTFFQYLQKQMLLTQFDFLTLSYQDKLCLVHVFHDPVNTREKVCYKPKPVYISCSCK